MDKDGHMNVVGAARQGYFGLFLTLALLICAATAPGSAEEASPPAPVTPPVTADPAPASVKTRQPPSACRGMDQATCKANSACTWVMPKKPLAKSGKPAKPYCRKRSLRSKTAAARPTKEQTDASAITSSTPAEKGSDKPELPRE